MKLHKHNRDIGTTEDWYRLAPPKKGKKHWKRGRSALECASAWCENAGAPAFPTELQRLLDSNVDTRSAEIVEAIPEHPIRFDGFAGPRHSDVCIKAQNSAGTIAISVEAKADESFDLVVTEVLARGMLTILREKDTEVVRRVQQLARSLLPARPPNGLGLGDLRYQLLTGVAGALKYAEKIGAGCAVFAVHEFITGCTEDWRHVANGRDLDLFLCRLTAGRTPTLKPGVLVGPIMVPGSPLFCSPVPLYVGKASRNLR